MKTKLLLAFFFLFSCAPESMEKYHTAENEEEIISLLNQREYGRAIWLVESRQGKNPEGKIAFLLGQAYLGKIGLEPLQFAAKVSGPEPETRESQIISRSCPRGALKEEKKLEMKCILKRVYLHSPSVDQIDFQKAKMHLRKSYPNPGNAPEWANVLIGMVETISLVKRAGDLYLYSKANRQSTETLSLGAMDMSYVKSQAYECLSDAREALGRANHSGEKVSRLLNGTKANEWFERIEGSITFSKTVGLAKFLDFARENVLKPSDEIRYGETLDRLKASFELMER